MLAINVNALKAVEERAEEYRRVHCQPYIESYPDDIRELLTLVRVLVDERDEMAAEAERMHELVEWYCDQDYD